MRTMSLKLARGSFLPFLMFFMVSCATSRNHIENSDIETDGSLPKVELLAENLDEPSSSHPTFNIPIVVNEAVERFIHYFQTSNRRHFTRWLERSSRYIPVMQEILKEQGLPTDLVYLAMIESGFNHQALSWASAVGPWQFIRGTAQRYGLKINWWIDERKDPLKATLAASQYLKDLYDMFNSWFLAAAGYNAGENKIKRAILKHNTQDFWELTRYRYLKPETKQYIPKFIAAALITKNPEKYGFEDIAYKDRWAYDLVTVDQPVDLRTVATVLDVKYADIRYLNPELRRWCTPPDADEYALRIPLGTKEMFLANYDKIVPKDKTIFHAHRIQSGDTLYALARQYGTSIHPIMELNKIKSARLLQPGRYLIIPVKAKDTNQT